MADTVDAATRSRMMAGIRGKDTAPEMLVRRGLHAVGLRFRLHATGLPGKPDLTLKRFHAAIFVNGCFWHHHDCHLFKIPATRTEFWKQKIEQNVVRDSLAQQQLQEMGWRVLIIWECALKGRSRLAPDQVIERTRTWLTGSESTGQVRGVS